MELMLIRTTYTFPLVMYPLHDVFMAAPTVRGQLYLVFPTLRLSAMSSHGVLTKFFSSAHSEIIPSGDTPATI